ncbi:hypothetical protein NDN08_004247 [Rhodosorus marinus]|uniref:Metalloendopeptidase n=1 Tax=Rhodosorus marinus TaxID=101924 RepID=A0AAV8UKQ6_9RHOD|nr:hypothetical protein NDN08_004247 [Rhodosorus marinus]
MQNIQYMSTEMGRTIGVVLALILLVTSGRGAILRDSSKRWPVGTPIAFAFEGFVAPGVRDAVTRALEEYSAKTCLEFKPAVRGVDRTTISFSSDHLDRCYQSTSGFLGDGHDHPIYIHPDCPGGIDLFTQALHETGRALGLIDLQRRPDRGQFLSVKRSRVRNNPAEREMFERMEWEEVSLEGVEDFTLSSVMLYGEFFLSQNGGRTMFPRKPGATLKSRKFKLGRGDITVLNRAYNCPGPATPGRLTLDLVKKTNLHPPEVIEVIAEAVDTDGLSTVQTLLLFNTGSRDIVDASLDFGNGSFQYVRIQARNAAGIQTEKILLSMLVPVVEGRTNKKLCEEPKKCAKNIRFRLNHVEPSSTAVCNQNACENDGICDATGGDSVICICKRGFAGNRCQHRYGELNVVVLRGQNLFNRDSGADGLSDPFVNFTARNAAGKTPTKPSLVKVNTLNPDWKQQRLNFGSSTWVELDAQVLDFSSWKRRGTANPNPNKGPPRAELCPTCICHSSEGTGFRSADQVELLPRLWGGF